MKDPMTEMHHVPAFKPGANTGERFVAELPSDSLETVTVGKSVDGRLPRAVMDAGTLAGRGTREAACACARTHAHKFHSITYTADKQDRVTIR